MRTLQENLELLVENKQDIMDSLNTLGNPNLVDTYQYKWADKINKLKVQWTRFLWVSYDDVLYVPASTVNTLRAYLFFNCRITELHFDANQVIKIFGANSLYGCSKLTKIYIGDQVNYFPDVTTINSLTFYNCQSLNKLEFGPDLTTIGANAFYRVGYNGLDATFIFHSTTPPTISANTFPTDYANYNYFRIFVPDESVELYKTASQWSTYASYIYPLSDYDI